MRLKRSDLCQLAVCLLCVVRLLFIGRGMKLTLKSPADQRRMREAGAQAAQLLTYLDPHVRPGVTTAELDRLAHSYTTEVLRARSAPLHYGGLIGQNLYDLGLAPGFPLTPGVCAALHAATHAVGLRGLPMCGFPAATCISVNQVVCHGIPDARPLRAGDIVNIDVTVITPDGWHGDSSRMWLVGGAEAVAPRAAALVNDTYEALWRGIRAIRPGRRVGDIGSAIQRFAEPKGASCGPCLQAPNPCPPTALKRRALGSGYGVVRDFFGHGIGQHFHEQPMVSHVGEPNTGALLEPGTFIDIA